LSAVFFSTAFQHSIFAIGSLFFANNPEAMFEIFVVSNSTLAIEKTKAIMQKRVKI